MSDAIKHECGIALLRLLKPLEFYKKKYGTSFYGLNKLYLLMEKQHNRGHDGAGVANIKFDVEPGNRYISRFRAVGSTPIQDVFDHIYSPFKLLEEEHPERLKDVQWLKDNHAFTGELFLGHLRYGTFGKNNIESCHPFLRQNNWMTRNLVLAGNFNLTNVDELFNLLVSIGQHPKEKSDTVTVLEKIGHFLDDENELLYQNYKSDGFSKEEATELISKNINLQRVLKNASEDWDGGYVMAGLIGHGDAFVFRDPSGIRPAFYYADDEIVVVTSERPVIQTAFNTSSKKIIELTPGNALIIKKNGGVSVQEIIPQANKTPCSFERIYFSRGNDEDIYKERKELGKSICTLVLKAVNNDIKNTVFSFIPNTAEVAFYGMVKGIETIINEEKKQLILNKGVSITEAELDEILSKRARVEKIAVKDVKMRTFITNDDSRNDLVSHVYDVTYGAIRKNKDNLVIIDDSIVRGTTLKQSILKILDTLEPKKIVVVSSAPQIRYPDCYGIDMAMLGDFIAFQAAISLLHEQNLSHIIHQTYEFAKKQEGLPKSKVINCVKEIYEPFTSTEISNKIGELLTPKGMKAEVEILYQTIEGLHDACKNHQGDWYFTGNYPTPGGNKVVNRAFINYVEGNKTRAY